MISEKLIDKLAFEYKESKRTDLAYKAGMLKAIELLKPEIELLLRGITKINQIQSENNVSLYGMGDYTKISSYVLSEVKVIREKRENDNR